MLTAVLEALAGPARRFGFGSLPRQVLDVVAPQRVGGRLAWAADGRAVIEVHGVDHPDSGRYIHDVQAALETCPGVGWARVNAVLGRVVVGLGAGGVLPWKPWCR